MSDEVARAYDAVAPQYAARFVHDLRDDDEAQAWLRRFVELVDVAAGPVADLGCGPGQAVAQLTAAGLPTIGVDLSEGLLAQARAALPDADLRVGDLTALDVGDGSLGGIHARYSIIHLPPERLAQVFIEWARTLAPGAPVLISFFASLRSEDHGRPFDHAVATAYELFPETVGEVLGRAGFAEVEFGSASPIPGGRPFGRGTVLAVRSGA